MGGKNTYAYLVGTDGDDSFDTNYFANASPSANLETSRVRYFLAGGGNDVMDGSSRNDNLWGCTGNDLLLGYAGDDNVYGEAGDDELQGQDGTDYLDGGIGNDKLFGQAGNERLWGGAGDDQLVGFAATNDPKQDLDAGDSTYADLRLWQDKNGDGISDPGELKTLSATSIQCIRLASTPADWTSGGNRIAGFGKYQRNDGSSSWTADIGLGHESDGWYAASESGLLRMSQSGGLAYGASLTLDLDSAGLDSADNDAMWRLHA